MDTLLSFGAGVQTTALLVLIATGRWPRPTAIVFADTEGEHEATYRYLRDVAEPYARGHGLEIHTLGGEWRAQSKRASLYDYAMAHKMLPAGFSRWCTHDYKITPIKHFRATLSPVVETWIGISTDEVSRAIPSVDPTEIKRYPLIELGLSRTDCVATISTSGLPVPPKSGCWFCPFKGQAAWRTLKRTEPELFMRAIALERNASRTKQGKKAHLALFGSLEQIAASEEFPGFDDAIASEGACVTGSCFV